jgi:hypothetical protein
MGNREIWFDPLKGRDNRHPTSREACNAPFARKGAGAVKAGFFGR